MNEYETNNHQTGWDVVPPADNNWQAYQQSPSYQPVDMKPVKQKKSGSGKRIAALVLCCALLGGGAGVGGAYAYSALSGASPASGSTALYTSDREAVTTVPVSSTGEPMTLTQIYEAYVNSCVSISAGSTTNYFGQTVTSASSGSGFIITADGYILTNYHVVEGASTLSVTLADGTEYDATYVGGEEDNDIAVLKIDADNLTPVVLGDSDEALVGETVCTIGNPLGQLTCSLTDGVISALDRTITFSDGLSLNMIQTNCTINSGNSGGPLFNSYGEVIGITSAKYSSSSSYSSSAASIEGLGFAIPINDVVDLVSDIIEHGYVTGKPYLGISVYDVSSDAQNYGIPAGAYVYSVATGSCAETAGLKAGDVITSFNGTEVASADELIAVKAACSAGDTVKLTVYRDGETLALTVTLDEETPDSDTGTVTTDDGASGSSGYSDGSGYSNGSGSSGFFGNNGFGR